MRRRDNIVECSECLSTIYVDKAVEGVEKLLIPAKAGGQPRALDVLVRCPVCGDDFTSTLAIKTPPPVPVTKGPKADEEDDDDMDDDDDVDDDD